MKSFTCERNVLKNEKGGIIGQTLISLAGHSNRLVRLRSRKLLLDWVTNVGPICAISDQKGFENLIENCADEITKDNRNGLPNQY